MRTDYFGQELNIDDTVVWSNKSTEARGFNFGTIVKFHPKMIEVLHATKKTARWNPAPRNWTFDCPTYVKLYPEQILKVDPELVTLKLLVNN